MPFASTIKAEAQRRSQYAEKKHDIALDDSERRLLINYLNDLRNSLISERRYTDAIDGVLLKIINAPIRKFKVICKEE